MTWTQASSFDVRADIDPVLLEENRGDAKGRPLLTLAIPAYRHAEFIQECLSGLADVKQHQSLEIVVLDDASPDETAVLARRWLRQLGIDFRIYRRSTNAGLTAGLDFLLSTARGSFVLFCASDDRISPDALDKVFQLIISTRFDRLAFVIFGASYFGDRVGPVYDAALLKTVTSSADALHKWVSEDFPRPLLLQSTVFRRDFLLSVDPWRERLLLDDWPAFILASKKAALEDLDIRFEPDIVLTHYRVHAGGLHAISDRQIAACLETVDRVVPERFRAIARTNVLANATLSYLSKKSFGDALRSYCASVRSTPSLRSLVLTPVLMARGVLPRVRRLFARRLW